ncbi:MAG: glycosyltransferase, partial [Gemmatimonadales bacterium]
MRVSAIIPTLNGARTLPLLLDGLNRAASRIPLEIVAIDSGSRDETLRLLQGAGAAVLDLGGRPFGHGSARNRAAAGARGAPRIVLTHHEGRARGDRVAPPLAPQVDDAPARGG